MRPDVQANKVVVLSGSGVSAESGLPTFRDPAGLWNSYSWEEVASAQGWKAHSEVVLDFYNQRRQQAWSTAPNAAHSNRRVGGLVGWTEAALWVQGPSRQGH